MSDVETRLRAALEPVASAPRHIPLDAHAAAEAIAAANLVAALAGETGAELPEDVRAWADATAADVGPLLALARDAVVRVAADEPTDEDQRQFLLTLERRLGTP